VLDDDASRTGLGSLVDVLDDHPVRSSLAVLG
jgi:hypothetical protein